MTRATELESRGNVFTPVYGVRTDIPPEVVCALSEGQVSLAWTPAEGVAVLRQPKGETTIPLRKLRLLPYRQNVGVAYG